MSSRSYIAAVILGISTFGCGDSGDMPEVGEVSGTVMLDGNPLPNANVLFYPTQGGRSSRAVTDESGAYTLSYNGTVQGAKVGPHVVSVSTQDDDDESESSEEIVPEKYRKNSVLKFDVAAGENSIDLALESK